MLIDLKNIMRYGEYYNCYSQRKYQPTWWLSMDDYEVYEVEDIMREYGYESTDAIEQAGYFVPIFQTNADELLEVFLKKEYPYIYTEIKKIYDEKKESVHDMDYGTAFRIFCEPYENWGIARLYQNFLNKHLYADAEAWCKKYHIRYKK